MKKSIWHVCYISKFNLEKTKERKKFFHFTNLRPKYHNECDHSNDLHFEALQFFLEEVGFNKQQ